MAAIGRRVTDYVLNAQQADLLAVLSGVFGPLGSSNSSAAFASMSVDAGGSGETDLSPRHLVLADTILGEDADTFGAMVVHPDVYAYLRVREMINYVNAAELPGITASTSISGINAIGGDFSGAFGPGGQVPLFANKAVIVSDNAPRTGSAGSYKYGVYVFKTGAIGQAFQAPVRTESDRDILTSGGEDVLKVQWDMCYHPLGASWAGGVNPSAADLATASNWTKVFDRKNLGVARITCTCPYYV
jgi:hypothetical protein